MRRAPQLAAAAAAACALLLPALAASAAPSADDCATVRDDAARRILLLDAADAAGGLTHGQTQQVQDERAILAAALRTCAPVPAPSPTGAPTAGPTHSATATAAPPGTPAPTGSPTPSPTPTAAWPGPDNTGVPTGTALTAYSGSCTITAPVLIDAKSIFCDLDIRAVGVRITRSRITGSVSTGEGTPYSVTIEDTEIDDGPRLHDAVGADNFTVLRSEIVGGNRGIYCRRSCTVQDSWVHGTYVQDAWHASGMRASQGSTFVHNTIACDWLTPTAQDGGCSADVTMYGDFEPVANVLVQGNLFVANPTGAAFCSYGGSSAGKPYSGAAHDIRFVGNVFQRGSNGKCAAYGPIDSFDPTRPGNLWSQNVWDSGEPVSP